MKKIMSAVLLILIPMAMTACGGSSDSQESDRQPPPIQNQQTQPPDTAQNVINEVGEALNQAQSGGNPMLNVSGEYYTFGDIITLWDEWELVFIDNVIITEPTFSLTSEANARDIEIANGEIVKIPAVLTNVTEADRRPQALTDNYRVYGSNGEVQPRRELDVAMSLMRDPDLGRIPSIHVSANPGEVVEGYIFLIYVGDGDYWLHWPVHLVSIPVRLPVSR